MISLYSLDDCASAIQATIDSSSRLFNFSPDFRLLAFSFYLDNLYLLTAIDEVRREMIVVILCSHLMLVLRQLQSVRMMNICDNILFRRYALDL